MWAEAGGAGGWGRDRKEIIVSSLPPKMTHTNEGLCHPDKAQEDGDSTEAKRNSLRVMF